MLGRQILFMDEGRVCGDCLFTAGSGKLRRGEGTPPYI